MINADQSLTGKKLNEKVRKIIDTSKQMIKISLILLIFQNQKLKIKFNINKNELNFQASQLDKNYLNNNTCNIKRIFTIFYIFFVIF